MQLHDLVYPNEILYFGTTISDFTVGKPTCNTKTLEPLDLFFCTDGEKTSGYSFLGEAKNRGAAAIITEKGGYRRTGRQSIPVIEVENVRFAYAKACSRYNDSPEKELSLIAVTGTNGKTSVSHFLASLLREAGFTVGEIGTVSYFDGKNALPADHTTPPPEVLYPLLCRMKQNDCTHVVMEASSHAISQERLAGLSFDCGIFTNLSRDHLDYHKTWDAYRTAKATLFRSCKRSLLNADDCEAKYMGFAAGGEVCYYGTKKDCEFQITAPQITKSGLSYRLSDGTQTLDIKAPLFGDFNIHNTAAAISAAMQIGVSPHILEEAATRLKAPRGRLEKLPLAKDYSVYIDYAHTPDALLQVLSALRPLGRLTVVFGAGGDRDQGKRAEMGHIAEENADHVILTSDNSRSEEPEAIIRDIEKGMKKDHTVIVDRKEAIEYAVNHAKAGDILLLAGKGHEETITDRSGKHRFSEREIVENKGKG